MKGDSTKGRVNSSLGKVFRGNIAVMASSSAVNGFGTGIISTYVSLYFVSIGGDALTLGVMTSISAVIQCLVLFLGGFIADHFGRRKAIVVAAFYAALFPALYVLIRDWRIFIAASAIGAFGAVSSPATHAIVADSIPVGKRTTGISTLQVVSSSPAIISPLIGGWLIKVYGLQSGFRYACIFTAGAAVVSAVILLFFLRETKPHEMPESGVSWKSGVSSYRVLSANALHSLAAMLSSYGLIALANGMVGSYYILYATQVVGLGGFDWGVIVSLQLVLVTFVKIPGGWASDRFGKKGMMLVSILACIPFVVMFTFSRSFLQAAVTVLLLTVAGIYYAPAHEALQADLTPTEVRGRITSFWDITSAVGTAVGASLGGFLFETFSPATPFYLFAAIEFAAALLILFAVKEPKEAEA